MNQTDLSQAANVSAEAASARPAGLPLAALRGQWKWLLAASIVSGGLGVGASFLVKPSFTARATIMPPQQQSSNLSALAGSLGALSGLAGIGGVKSTADQYVAMLSSVTVTDRIIDKFDLMTLYDMKYRSDVRKKLNAGVVTVASSKKDGLITIDVEDHEPQRAADMVTAYVEELKALTNRLAVTEAQQRRVFFERQLAETRDKLTQAQIALQSSGIDAAAVKSEPRAAADAYAKARAELTTAEVKLQALSANLAPQAPELLQQQAVVGALRREVGALESRQGAGQNADYVSRYREFKYQETLFDVYARQFELARLDESREGALIQVIDPALVPDKKSKPKRLYFGLAGAFLGLVVAAAVIVRRGRQRPALAS